MTDEPAARSTPSRRKQRSARYPGATLDEAIDFAREVGDKGVDGLPASAIATAMGYSSIKTQTFSARLSASRQFGLLALRDGNYHLTSLARSLLHPVDPAQLAPLRTQAFLQPPLYADLIEKLAGRKLPETPALANWLYHHHDITASAKETAAATFLASAREIGALDESGILRLDSSNITPAPTDDEPAPPTSSISPPAPPSPPRARPTPRTTHASAASPPAEPTADVTFTLRLWGPDQGKTLRLLAPESISRESYERFLQTLQLMVHIRDDD